MSLFGSIVRVGTRIVVFFPLFFRLDHCAVANLIEFCEGNNFRCLVCISLRVGILIIFDSAPESFKKSISRSGGDSKSLIFGLIKRSGIVQIFSLIGSILFVVF